MEVLDLTYREIKTNVFIELKGIKLKDINRFL